LNKYYTMFNGGVWKAFDIHIKFSRQCFRKRERA
jgi:hypothetical protein